jgi:hypothetical protein
MGEHFPQGIFVNTQFADHRPAFTVVGGVIEFPTREPFNLFAHCQVRATPMPTIGSLSNLSRNAIFSASASSPRTSEHTPTLASLPVTTGGEAVTFASGKKCQNRFA